MTAFEFANTLVKNLNIQVFSFVILGNKGKVTVPFDTDVSSVKAPGVEFNQRGKWMDIHYSV